MARDTLFLIGATELFLVTLKRDIASVIAVATRLQLRKAMAHGTDIFFPCVSLCYIPRAVVVHTLITLLIGTPCVMAMSVNTPLNTGVDIVDLTIPIITPSIRIGVRTVAVVTKTFRQSSTSLRCTLFFIASILTIEFTVAYFVRWYTIIAVVTLELVDGAPSIFRESMYGQTPAPTL